MFNNNNDTVSSNVSHIGEGLQVEGDLILKELRRNIRDYEREY